MASPVPWLDMRAIVDGSGLVTGRIQYPNEVFSAPAVDSQNPVWVDVEDVGEQLLPLEIPTATGVWEERGRFLFTVYQPRNTGTIQARTLAKQISNLFRGLGARPVVYDGMSIGGTLVSQEDGNIWAILVSVGFRYQDILTP